MPKRILVIDDDQAFRWFVIDALRMDGHDVDEAEDGVGAMGLCLTREYDIIITDMRMPGLSGNEVIAWLRENNFPSRIIAISGHPERDAALAVSEVYEVDQTLRKPVRLEELRERVRRLAAQKVNVTR